MDYITLHYILHYVALHYILPYTLHLRPDVLASGLVSLILKLASFGWNKIE